MRSCSFEDEYGLRDVDVDGKLVYDLGAHVGGVAVWLATRGARVVAVEPVPENVELLRRNAELNDVAERVIVVEGVISEPGVDFAPVRYGFVGDENAEVNAWIGNTGLMLEGYASTEQVSARAYTFTELVNAHGPSCVVKTDCEGGEWALFADPAALAVPLLVGEWHDRSSGFLRDGMWVETAAGYDQLDVLHLLSPTHDVVFVGPSDSAGGFRAVLRQ